MTMDFATQQLHHLWVVERMVPLSSRRIPEPGTTAPHKSSYIVDT